MNTNSEIKKTSLGQEAAKVIRNMIYSQELVSGERILEQNLSQKFNVSRACIRDAINLLEAEGLITKQNNKSATVRSFTGKEVLDLFQARLMIECTSAVFCIENNTIPEKKLEDSINCMRESVERIDNGENAQMDLLNADLQFHNDLIGGAGNTYLTGMWMNLQSQYRMLICRLFRERERCFVLGVEGHEALLNALLRGVSKNELEKLFYAHVMSNYETILKRLNAADATQNKF